MTKRKESLIHLESSCSVLGPGGRKPVTHSVRSAGSFHRCGEQGCLEKTWTQPVGVGGMHWRSYTGKAIPGTECSSSWRSTLGQLEKGLQCLPGRSDLTFCNEQTQYISKKRKERLILGTDLMDQLEDNTWDLQLEAGRPNEGWVGIQMLENWADWKTARGVNP